MDGSESLYLERRWRWPLSYRSIEVLAIFVDALIIVSAGVLADAAYRLTTTALSSEMTIYGGAAAVVAALLTCLLKERGPLQTNRAIELDRPSPSRYNRLDRRVYVPGRVRVRAEDRKHVFSRHYYFFRHNRSVWPDRSADVLAHRP